MSETWAELLERPEIHFDPARLRDVVAGRRVLITGAGGSVGGALARTLIGWDLACLILLDWHEASLFHLEQTLASSGLGVVSIQPRYVLADVRDRRKMDHLLRRQPVDLIFHLAACKHVSLGEANPDQAVSVNIGGTLDLVGVAAERDVATFVYPSTDKAVTPSSLYGATKRVVERSLQALAATGDGPALRVVRLVNVFGTQGSVIETFARKVRRGEALPITDPRMDRYWITMAEANALLLAAAGRPRFEGFYLLDVGDPVPIGDTARKVYRILRGAGEPNLQLVGGRPGERLHEYLAYDDEDLRSTELPGLRVAVSPPSAIGADAWLTEIRRLTDALYDLDSAKIRERVFELAAAKSLTRASNGSSGWT